MPTRPRLLDLFCGAGGAAMGYRRAGFEVVGVDLHPQPHYPFEFHQGDALTFPLEGFDAIHASPPCQAYSAMQNIHKNSAAHPDLIGPIRGRLVASERPWVIENVKGSPLRASVRLCGTMFGLRITKHRYFETSFRLPALYPPCNHSDVYDPWHGTGRSANQMRAAQETPWIPSGDVNNAIPPALTEWIGKQLMVHLREPSHAH